MIIPISQRRTLRPSSHSSQFMKSRAQTEEGLGKRRTQGCLGGIVGSASGPGFQLRS